MGGQHDVVSAVVPGQREGTQRNKRGAVSSMCDDLLVVVLVLAVVVRAGRVVCALLTLSTVVAVGRGHGQWYEKGVSSTG